MLAKLRQRLRAGQRYDGPAAWSDDYSAVPRPGYYALTEDGKHLRPDVPLVCVDDAPGDALDGSCHFEYAGPRDYPQRSGGKPVEAGEIVSLEVEAEGRTEVAA
jgi:hypothetical protein